MIDIRCPQCGHKLLYALIPESKTELEIMCAKCKSIIVIQVHSTGYDTRTKEVGRHIRSGRYWKPTDFKGE